MQTLLNNRTAVPSAHVAAGSSRKGLVVRSVAAPEKVTANGNATRARVGPIQQAEFTGALWSVMQRVSLLNASYLAAWCSGRHSHRDTAGERRLQLLYSASAAAAGC
eukprot:GHUV01049142.1.p2 GENE.GHUV01049142.1~~GHUV01049142.1.p2  ORF type:complete len:107 (-),score=12.42 GHUV01049142.1:496-816(-)